MIFNSKVKAQIVNIVQSLNLYIRYPDSKLGKFVFCLLLSWFYALCSQIIIPLPFNFVPISLQPAPVWLCSLWLGWPAVYAFLICLIQTAFGAPFFSGFAGGIAKLAGPTGGYIFGWALGMIFLAATRGYKKNNSFITFSKLLVAGFLQYLVGLFQLQFFVPNLEFMSLLSVGLFPFLPGQFLKVFFISTLISKFKVPR